MYRPSYHFLPKENWMNDPNGVCWYKGKYHLFYQYNPDGDQWGNLHWGHAESEDCIHWNHLPLALYPSREKGEIHCFSGCASVDGEQPLIYYTSVGEEERDSRCGAQQWVAYSDDMVNWTKAGLNPIMTVAIHNGMEILEWRDPFVWKEEDGWYMVLGAQKDNKGLALLYYSKDQLHWDYLHVLMRSERPEETIWECPNYFHLGERAVLVYSPADMTRYYIGQELKGHQFVPEASGVLDYSGMSGFYAPNSFLDGDGRRIMIGWLTEQSRKDKVIPGWQGVQSIPRVLSVDRGELHMRPLPELAGLRVSEETVLNLDVSQTFHADTVGKAVEIILTLEPEKVEVGIQLAVFASDSGKEKTVIGYNKEDHRIFIDRMLSNEKGLTETKELSCIWKHPEEKQLKLHLFLDYSTIELFINDVQTISTRCYPEGEGSGHIFLKGMGGKSDIKEVNIYRMSNIW